jgi:hypothetical protein
MSDILDFYRGLPVHPTGFTFDEALRLPNVYWEKCHELVQWFFPLPEPSKMHPTAPIATEKDFEAFKTNQELGDRLTRAVNRYVLFLKGYSGWRRKKDHNHLRVTRIIRCLTLAGMPGLALSFYHKVLLFIGPDGIVPHETIEYWKEALNEHPSWLGA